MTRQERRQLEGTIQSLERNAAWYDARGCPVSAERIRTSPKLLAGMHERLRAGAEAQSE